MNNEEKKKKDLCQHCVNYWTDFQVIPEKVYIPRCDELIKKHGLRANLDEYVEYPCLKCPFNAYKQKTHE